MYGNSQDEEGIQHIDKFTLDAMENIFAGFIFWFFIVLMSNTCFCHFSVFLRKYIIPYECLLWNKTITYINFYFSKNLDILLFIKEAILLLMSFDISNILLSITNKYKRI